MSEILNTLGGNKTFRTFGAGVVLIGLLTACDRSANFAEPMPNGDSASCRGAVRYDGGWQVTYKPDKLLKDKSVKDKLDYLVVQWGDGKELNLINPNDTSWYSRNYNMGEFVIRINGWYDDNRLSRKLCEYKLLMSPSPGPGNEDKIGQPYYPIGERNPKCDFVLFKPEEGVIDFNALREIEGDRTLSYEYSGKEMPSSANPTKVKIDKKNPDIPLIINYDDGEWIQCYQ